MNEKTSSAVCLLVSGIPRKGGLLPTLGQVMILAAPVASSPPSSPLSKMNTTLTLTKFSNLSCRPTTQSSNQMNSSVHPPNSQAHHFPSQLNYHCTPPRHLQLLTPKNTQKFPENSTRNQANLLNRSLDTRMSRSWTLCTVWHTGAPNFKIPSHG